MKRSGIRGRAQRSPYSGIQRPDNAQTGTYILVIGNSVAQMINVGRLGKIRFPRGYYLYVGSALGPGGLRARVGRHFSSAKKAHWHIDHLTMAMGVQEAWHCVAQERQECRWNGLLATLHDTFPVKGFGSTDCGCYSHLHYFKNRPDSLDFQALIEQHMTIQRG